MSKHKKGKKRRSVAGCDASGLARCYLCGWKRQGTALEQIEFWLVEHLKNAHGKQFFYRQDEDGQRWEIPP